MCDVQNVVAPDLNVSNISSGGSEVAVAPPPWVAPPLDAWKCHHGKLTALFVYYSVTFVIGEFVNWLCLLNINKAKLAQSTRFLMMTQCVLNTSYITINFPYKAAILYLQRTFLPLPLKLFCGWLRLFVVLGTIFLQDAMAVSRVIYIVFPHKAKSWFSTTKQSLLLIGIPLLLGSLYAFPSLHPCCYRFYKFTSFSLAYVGPKSQVQLKFSMIAAGSIILMLSTCYSWVFLKIRATSRAVHDEKGGTNRDKKEIRLTMLFGMTGGAWFLFIVMFYSSYYSNLITAYSIPLLLKEMLEGALYLVDPIVYIVMSTELRRPLMMLVGIDQGRISRRGTFQTSTTPAKPPSFRYGNDRRSSSIPELAWRRSSSIPNAVVDDSEVDVDAVTEEY